MATFRTPYNLQPAESCRECGGTACPGFFCHLPDESLKKLEAISFVSSFPEGAVLFVEGQTPRGVYMLCRGQAKLSVVSEDGRTLILKIAGPGEVMGLSSCVMGRPYEATVETLSPCQVNFVRTEDFLRLIRQDGNACLRAALQISRQYQNACRELRWVGLSRSADWKLASLLLGLGEEREDGNGSAGEPVTKVIPGQPSTFKMTLTHEEIAQMIGTTRETVTRVFARLKKQKLVEVRGATVVLRDIKGLQEIAGRAGMTAVEPPEPPSVPRGHHTTPMERLPRVARMALATL
jgi:CRP/FNR family transcriptional regulator